MTRRICVGAGVVGWVAHETNEFGDFGCARGIGLEEDIGRPAWKMIAGVVYAQWNGPNVVCHIASDKTKRWLNREYLWTIFDYPFNQLKVERITVCIGSGNKDSIKFVEHLGFEFETFLKDAHPTGNLLVYVMRKPHCRWLGLKTRVSHEERLAA